MANWVVVGVRSLLGGINETLRSRGLAVRASTTRDNHSRGRPYISMSSPKEPTRGAAATQGIQDDVLQQVVDSVSSLERDMRRSAEIRMDNAAGHPSAETRTGTVSPHPRAQLRQASRAALKCVARSETGESEGPRTSMFDLGYLFHLFLLYVWAMLYCSVTAVLQHNNNRARPH